MSKCLEMVRAFLATQLNYISALFIAFTIYFGILKKQPDMWKFMLLALLPFGFYLIRAYVKRLVLFSVLHIGLALLPYFLAGNIAEFIIFMLMGFIFGGVSIYFKVTRPQPEDGVLFVAMTCILAVIAYFSSISGMGEKTATTIAFLAITYVVCYMIYEYTTGYINYIKNNEVSNQNIPKKQIFTTSASTLVGFLTLFVGFALLLVKGNFLADLVYKIGDAIKRFIIWLLSFAPEAMEQGGGGDEPVAIETIDHLVEKTEKGHELSPEIAELIDNIVTIGAYVISIVAVLVITYALFRAIAEALKVKREANEEEVVLVKEKREKIRRGSVVKTERRSQFSKDKKIRKMYEELVWKKNIGPKPDKAEKKLVAERLKHQTPKEQCRYMDSGEPIRRMYEKARYSGAEMTKNDVRAMKEICALEAKSR